MDEHRSGPRIVEDRLNGDVLVDGIRVWGFIDRARTTGCGHAPIYSERYDAYFCPVDNCWDSKECGDPSCKRCRERPERPLDGPLDAPSDPSTYL